MRKFALLLTCLLLCGIHVVFAQSRTITGTVTDVDDGSTLPGVSVVVKGTSIGTVTNIEGKFSLNVPSDAKVLRLSFVGFEAKEITLTPANNYSVVFEKAIFSVDEVVVTALGITRATKGLGYSATTVSVDDITSTGNRSAINALQGKVAGVEISSASGSPGASTRVIMRGFSSLGGSNQPLYVVDGTPVSNSQIGSTSINGGVDFGNRANDLNSEDIESMTILKGGSATALYGSRAASGVILITTKNGSKSNNKAKVEVSSTTTFDTPLRLPYFQNEFGQGWYNRTTEPTGDLQENGSWGPRFDGEIRKWGFVVDNQQMIKPFVALPTNVSDFFDTGKTFNNSVSISNGDKEKNFFLSLGNISANGIMPTDADSYKRYNISMRGSTKFLKIFTASASMNYVRKDSKFVETGQDQSVLDGLWQSARDISFVDQMDYNNKFNNVDNYFTAYAQNPYFILNEHGNKFQENRIFGNVSLDAQILTWLSATFKAGSDVSSSSMKRWRSIFNSSRYDYNDEVGRVSENSYFNSEINTDFILTANPKISDDFTLNAIVGHNFNQRDSRSQGAEVIGLDIPKFYDLSNSSATPSVFGTISQRRLVGLYGSIDMGFKDMLFLNLSARNDWSSTLPSDNRSFFYPSLSTSFVFSELIDAKNIFSFGKIRFGVAQTGKDADPYQIFPVMVQTSHTDGYRTLDYPLAKGSSTINGFTLSNVIGNEELQPEISTDIEVGLDLKFFNNRLGLDVAVYNKIVTDLIWTASIPSSTGFTSQTQNLGKISNKGVEVLLNAVPVKTSDFEWEVYVNFSKNNNLLVELKDGLDQISLGGTSSIGFVGRPGMELGLFEGIVPATDPDGRMIVDAAGLPTFKDTKEIIGTSQNKFRIGGGTSLKYKDFSLRASFDYRNGGQMYSRTAEILYFTGNALPTTYNDRQPFIIPNSVQFVNGKYVENTIAIAGFSNTMNQYYNQTYNAGKGGAYALIDKTFFKIREVSLSYSLPKKLLASTFFTKAEISLVGNNLFLWTPNSNLYVDPEMTTFGNDMAADFGDYGATPSTKSIGFSVKLGF